MSNKTITEVIENTSHPLEEFFGIEPNSTEVVKYEHNTELVDHEEYDEKDNEIESGLQEIADKALSGYENLQSTVEDIDPKYAARTLEVANQLLSTALNAIKEKAAIKGNKDKLKIAKQKVDSSGNGNTTIIMDTNSMIERLKQMQNAKIINVGPEVKPLEIDE